MPSSSSDAPRPAQRFGARKNWRDLFLASLAETSNVTVAAGAAGISLSCAYRTKRTSRDFAEAWLAALCEGYDRLELELLARLRGGEPRQPGEGAGPRHDNATALRLLLAHRESRARYRARYDHVTAEAVRASIEDKLARLRDRVLEREAAERTGDAG